MRKIILPLIMITMIPASQTYGAQMDVFVTDGDTEIKPEFKFLRIIFIEYPKGGQIAENLTGKKDTIAFSADSSQLQYLIQQINSDLQKRSSNSAVVDITVEYQATITGGQKQAAIEYKINMVPTIKGFELRAKDVDLARIIDSTWRGFDVDVPIVIDTEYGSFDINSPSSALEVFDEDMYKMIQNAKPDSVINENIFDASGIAALPLNKWHFLFDPTAIIEESKNMGFSGKTVVSHYSMGECNIEVGPCSDRTWTEEISADQDYKIRMIESQDDATISIEGFVTKEYILGLEVFGINPQATDNPNTATDEFPAMVIYGMASIAAIGGGIFFFISNRKLKGESGQGQRGIDPSMLVSYSTSESSGGYHTNRGESQLRNSTKKTAI